MAELAHAFELFLNRCGARALPAAHHALVDATIARLEAMHLLAPGATGAVILPFPILNKGATGTMHLAGTARMGVDPRTSVCAPSGRMHDLSNVYVADASTFPTFPGFNPTLTIMANALRIARRMTTNPGE